MPPMTDRTFATLKSWSPLVGMLLALGAMWATLQADVRTLRDQKVDRAEFLEVLRAVERVGDRVERSDVRMQRIETFLCQGRIRDLGCQR